MTDSEQLREQMWDYVYGLLSPEEGESLIARIKSDPQAARLYAEVRLQADLVGYASRIDDPALVLEAPGSGATLTPGKVHKRTVVAEAAPAMRSRSWRRGGSWLTGGLATALALLLAVGHFWPHPNDQQIAARFIVTDIETPPALTAGLTSKIALRTSRLGVEGERGQGVPATLGVTLRGLAGEALLHRQVVTSEAGRGTVEVPGSLLEPGVKLEIDSSEEKSATLTDKELAEAIAPMADDSGAEASLAVALPVQQEPQVTYFLLEDPAAQADKPMNFACWNFSSFSGKPVPAGVSQKSAESLAALTVAESKKDADRDYGVVTGVLQPAQFAARGLGALAYGFGADQKTRSTSRSVVGQQVAGVGGVPPSAGAADVRLQPAQNELRAGAAKPATEAPADEKQLKLKREAGAGQTELAVEGKFKGGASQALRIPAGQQQILVEIPSELAGKPLTATVICRGATVTSLAVPADDSQSSASVEQQANKRLEQELMLDLPPEVDGRIDIAFFDRSSTPPQLVRQDSLYREPARKLQIDLPNLKDRFAPGERVQLMLQVADEAGQPAANTLVGVRVWNEALIRESGQPPVMLEAAARDIRSEQVVATEQTGKTVPAIVAGRSPEEAKVPLPPQTPAVLTSNRPTISARYDRAAAEASGQRQSIVRTIGGVVVAGGLLLAVLLGALLVMRMPSNVQVMIPAVVVVTASLLVGLAWVGRPLQSDQRQIAMATQPALGDQLSVNRSVEDQVATALAASAPQPQATGSPREAPSEPSSSFAEGAKAAAARPSPAGPAGGGFSGGGGGKGAGAEVAGVRRLADAPAASSAAGQAPASLYFNPQVITDAEGRATIEFEMPRVDSEYRLLIDALGNGRIGSRQQLIVGRAAEGK